MGQFRLSLLDFFRKEALMLLLIKTNPRKEKSIIILEQFGKTTLTDPAHGLNINIIMVTRLINKLITDRRFS